MNKVKGSMHVFQSEAERDALQYLETNATTNTMGLLSMYSNETDLNFNSSNLTSSADWRQAYKPVLDVLLLALVITVMLTMGCDITWQNLLGHFKKPIGLVIGILSQFGILPLSAFCILLISGISGLHATGVLIISCSPGGVLSNSFTYFCDGESSLSVAMTSVSTLVAMGMMPLNMWLYGRHFESEDLVMPYTKMVLSLVFVLTPFVIGMLLKWKLPRVSSYITKFGGYSMLILLVACIGVEFALFHNMFVGIPFRLYAAVALLPVVGLTLGYGLAYILKQNNKIRKTIALECGVQNVPVALAVIAMSFPIEMQKDIVFLPWIYGIASLVGSAVVCLSYQFYSKCSKKKTDDSLEDGIAEKKDHNKQGIENG